MSKGKNGFRLILAPRTKISRKFYYHFFEAFQYDKKGVLIVDVKLRVETEVFIQGGWVGVAVRFLGLRLVVPVCPVKNFFEARIIGGRKVLLRNWHYCAKCKKNSGVAVADSLGSVMGRKNVQFRCSECGNEWVIENMYA